MSSCIHRDETSCHPHCTTDPTQTDTGENDGFQNDKVVSGNILSNSYRKLSVIRRFHSLSYEELHFFLSRINPHKIGCQTRIGLVIPEEIGLILTDNKYRFKNIYRLTGTIAYDEFGLHHDISFLFLIIRMSDFLMESVESDRIRIKFDGFPFFHNHFMEIEILILREKHIDKFLSQPHLHPRLIRMFGEVNDKTMIFDHQGWLGKISEISFRIDNQHIGTHCQITFFRPVIRLEIIK